MAKLSDDEKRRRGYISELTKSDDQAHWPESSKFTFPKPKGHDKELEDTERAHSGAPGSKVRHGADAAGVVKAPKMTQGEPVDSGKKFGNV